MEKKGWFIFNSSSMRKSEHSQGAEECGAEGLMDFFFDPISDNDTDFKGWGAMTQRGKHHAGWFGHIEHKGFKEMKN